MDPKKTCLTALGWLSTNIDKLTKRVEEGSPLKHTLNSVRSDAERILTAGTLLEAQAIAKVIIKKIG